MKLNPKYRMVEPPLSVGASAVYPYSEALAERFSAVSRYGDPYAMYRDMGSGESKRLLIPRRCAPLANDRRLDGLDVELDSSFSPRNAEQARVVQEAAGLLLAGESFLFEAPTGFGKTACALDVIARVGKKTLIVVTKEDVKTQWAEAFRKFLGLDKVGLFQGDKVSSPNLPVAIGMIQSLARPGKYPQSMFNDYGLVIWDEVHRVGADVFSNTAWLFPGKLRMGLSATPYRKDGKEQLLYAHIGEVEVRTEMANLTPHVVVCRTGVTLPRVRKANSDEYMVLQHEPGRHAHITKMLAGSRERNALIARFVRKAFDAGRHVIVFSEQRKHLERLRDMIVMQGVPSNDLAEYVGGMTHDAREKAKVHRVLLSTYSMASEATDIPWLDTMVLGTPRSDVVQIVGRILREYPDKKQPLVLDLIDDDSHVFQRYSENRRKWYKAKGATVQFVRRDDI